MDVQAMEAAVREVAFVLVLAIGALGLAGCAVFMLVWMIKAVLRFVGVYSDFVAFSRARRGTKKKKP